ncbi:MAG: hypothetical protein WCJ19_00215 [bacterium]
MKRFKNIFNIMEFFLLLLIVIIVYIIATGYKYDFEKKVLVQTGALTIENLEDNTTVLFNNEKYKDERNHSFKQLDQKNYTFKITKDSRKDYTTSVDIKQGEVIYISPILIPNHIKINSIRENISNISTSERFMFYTVKEDNKIFIERLTLNKSLFNVDSTIVGVNITGVLDFSKSIKITHNDNGNSVLISDDKKTLLIDFNKSIFSDISSLIPSGAITSYELRDNYLIIRYEQLLYSFNISDIQKVQKNLVFTGSIKSYSIGENNNIYIIYAENDKIYIETFSIDGVSQNKTEIVDSPDEFAKNNISMSYFYQNIYIINNDIIYKLNKNKIIEFEKNISSIKIQDRNTAYLIGKNKISLLSKDKYFTIGLKYSPIDMQVFPDLFTFFYSDSEYKIHLADFGGQDNIVTEDASTSFLMTQNGSDSYIYFGSKSEIKYIKFGND